MIHEPQPLLNTIRRATPHQDVRDALAHGTLTLMEYVACLACLRREQRAAWEGLRPLSAMEFRTLCALNADGMSVADVADLTGMTTITVNGHMRRLAGRGYVAQVRKDKHHRMFVITRAGELVADQAYERAVA